LPDLPRMTAAHKQEDDGVSAIPIQWKPLTPRQKESARSRIRRWKKRDLWLLQEACELTFGFMPFFLYRYLNLKNADAEDLFDYAVRAVAIGNLKVINPSAPKSQWWVEQAAFCQWVTTRADLIGQDRVDLLRELYPTPQADQRKALRRKVLESEYTSAEFEAALSAIAEFWLPDSSGKVQDHKAEVITQWLEENHPEVCKGEAARLRIDVLIRPDQLKIGGAKKQKRVEP